MHSLVQYVEKGYHHLRQSNRLRTVVKDRYLRDDIGCGSVGCLDCTYGGSSRATLSDDETATNIHIIPDTNVLLYQLDVLFHDEFLRKRDKLKGSQYTMNMIILGSVMEQIENTNRGKHRKIKTLLQKKRPEEEEWDEYGHSHDDASLSKSKSTKINLDKDIFHMYTFANGYHKHIYKPRKKGQSLNDYSTDMLLRTYHWYNAHWQAKLKQKRKMFIICNNDPNEKKKYFKHLNEKKDNENDEEKEEEEEDIQVLCIDELLAKFYAPVDEIAYKLLTDCLSHIVITSSMDLSRGFFSSSLAFTNHWSLDRIERELENSTIVKGKYLSLYVRGPGENWQGSITPEGHTYKVLIQGLSNINRAVHDDIVAVQLLQDTDEQKDDNKVKTVKGKVVGIIARNWREYVVSIEETDKKSGIVKCIPMERRIPKILIETQQVSNLLDKRIVVRIDRWDADSMLPYGHYIQTIGKTGDFEVETQCLLIEHNIPNTNLWSDAVLQCLPRNDEIPESERNNPKRRDIRHLCVFSVDPLGCTDIDDALHCLELSNGNLEIGVHIADVAFYVKNGTPLDDEASKRGTSVYLVDRRLDMLPSLLSTDVCSLVEGKDRLTFSVSWEMTKDGEILDTQFYRSIICSRAALSYRMAQDRINSQMPKDDITDGLTHLLAISEILKKKRIEKGSLVLTSPQPYFRLDKETKKPTKLEPYPMLPTNSMIEEFMLLANITVAKQIVSKYPSFAMLRRHPYPSPNMMEPLAKCASVKGFRWEMESPKQLNQWLNDFAKKNQHLDILIRSLAIRCLTQALYFTSGDVDPVQFFHFGLATDIYTHFTSPIRRYADIVVHRQLAASIGIAPLPESIKDRNRMSVICENINRRHRMAQRVGIASDELYTLMFFDGRCVETDAVISSVDRLSIDVHISEYCMERKIFIVSKNDADNDNGSAWKFDDKSLILYRVTPPAVQYQVFDPVRVQITVHTTKATNQKKLVVKIIGDDNASKLFKPDIENEDIHQPANAAE
ncbi:hypothetical protein RFI_29325 [Reticulomyxa filosa]|uniref:Ribosomal RNA-processing protein 44 n=1 Tax=Reticulomyxa filosa TaxID=46433 RepID=X6M4V0_RETFI|nr:hypothetical protein RFI_29325 [Reticulomyxa filosa]|eukprot:ETO08065.1 hypothetical protein RFI_29325 [Reticulomyxa filosa]